MRDVFERALGADEPPLTLDLAEITRRGRRRRVAGPLGVAAVVVLVGLGAGMLFGHNGSRVAVGRAGTVVVPSVRQIAYCYRAADLHAGYVPFGLAGGDTAAASPDICRQQWQDNVNGWLPDPLSGKAFAVPPLTPCVLTPAAAAGHPDVRPGAVGIFPGPPDVCRALGLPAADLR